MKTEIALRDESAPSCAPILSSGIIWLVAAGMTEMKAPEQKPKRQAKATTIPTEEASCHRSRQKRPARVVNGYKMLRRPRTSAKCPPLEYLVS